MTIVSICVLSEASPMLIKKLGVVAFVLTIGACSEEEKSKAAGQAQSGVREAAAAATAPAASRDTATGTAPAKAKATVDCAALLTSDEVAAACGHPVEMKVSMMESSGAGTCVRSFVAPGNHSDRSHSTVSFNLAVYPNVEGAMRMEDPEDDTVAKALGTEENYLELKKHDIGDRAWSFSEHQATRNETEHIAKAMKGAVVAKVWTTEQAGARQKRGCTTEGLLQLTKTVTERLPD